MTDDQTRAKANGRPDQAKSEKVGQQAQLNQANAAAKPTNQTSPGRGPLFRK